MPVLGAPCTCSTSQISAASAQEAELRFKNDKDIDVVYRMAVRATASSDGLMELALACPGSMTTESELWLELTDRVTIADAP